MRQLLRATTTFVLLITPLSASAAVRTWDAGGGDNNWSTAANWSLDTVPTGTDIALFDGTGKKNATVDAAFAGSVAEVRMATANTGAITLVRSLTVNGNLSLSGGTLQLNGGNTITVKGSWQNGGGTLSASTGSVLLSSSTSTAYTLKEAGTFYHLSLSGAGTWTLAANTDVNGRLTLSGGTLSQSSFNISVAGNMAIANGATFTRGAQANKLILDGTVNLADNSASKQNLGYVQIGPTAVTHLRTDTAVYRLDVGTGATLNSHGYDFTAGTGSLIIFGTLNATDDAEGDTSIITLAGHWTRKSSGTFTHGNGTVVLNGSNQTLSGSTTFYNLTKTITSSATLTFAATTTQTVSNTLTLLGAAGNPLSLRSSLTGVRSVLTLTSALQDLRYLDVRDSNASGGTTLTCSQGCVDSGNNLGWSFPASSSSDSGGGGSALWLINLRRRNNLSLQGGALPYGTGAIVTVPVTTGSTRLPTSEDSQKPVVSGPVPPIAETGEPEIRSDVPFGKSPRVVARIQALLRRADIVRRKFAQTIDPHEQQRHAAALDLINNVIERLKARSL